MELPELPRPLRVDFKSWALWGAAKEYALILAVTFEDFLQAATSYNKPPKALGLLFARPGSPFVRDNLLPQLDDLHHSSQGNVHIWCVGYCAYSPRERMPDVQRVGLSVAGTPWDYSASSFHDVKRHIEGRTNWRLDGEGDLVLFSVASGRNAETFASVAFDSAFCFDLSSMAQSGTIGSVGGFFESIFRYARTYESDDLVADYYSSPSLPDSKAVPLGIRINWSAAKVDWNRRHYPGVIHHCASTFEAMAKHLTNNPNVQDKSLGSFFSAYRSVTSLDGPRLDRVLELYKLRNTVANAGHGSNEPSGVTMEEAFAALELTAECVSLEYAARVRYVGRMPSELSAA